MSPTWRWHSHCHWAAAGAVCRADRGKDRDVTPTRDRAVLNAVLFDLYGTTLDIKIDEDSPELWRGMAAALSESGLRVDAPEVRRRFQRLLEEEATRGREGFLMEPVFRRLLEPLGAGGDLGRIGKLFRELSLKEMRLRPYVEPLFGCLLHSGVKMGIVSNTEAILSRFELDRYPIFKTVHTLVLSSDVGVRKPDPRIFQLALDRIGGAPATAVFVGNDWDADILGATGAGLRAIYLNDRAAEGGAVAFGPSDIIEVAPTFNAWDASASRFGRLFRGFTRHVDQPPDGRAGADAKRPVSTEPAAGVLIRRRGPHHTGQERMSLIDRANRQGVDRLCIAGLLERAKTLPSPGRSFAMRYQSQTTRRFVIRTVRQEHFPSTLHRKDAAMLGTAAPYLVALFAALFSGFTALTLIYTVSHLDPPERTSPSTSADRRIAE